jgi:hypothetical protein
VELIFVGHICKNQLVVLIFACSLLKKIECKIKISAIFLTFVRRVRMNLFSVSHTNGGR